MGLLTLTAIPADFGSGGRYFNPTGNTPTLQALLQEHHDALNTLDSAGGGDASVISAATPTALAAVSVATFPTGKPAWVVAALNSAGALYTLQAAVSTTPDGYFVIATLDDSSRQWVLNNLGKQAFIAPITQELDFTQTQTVVVLPPLPFTIWESLTVSAIVTQATGTITTAPTIHVGTDSSFANMVPSGVQTAALGGTPTVGARTALTGATSANVNSLNPNGLKVVVAVGATLGTSSVLKGRIVFSMGLY